MSGKINCDVWIRHASCLMEDMTVAEDMAIAIKDGKILTVEKEGKAENAYTAAETVDGQNRLFLPGLVDGHMHTGQQLLRGAVLDELPMIWTRIMLPFESTLTPEKMRLSASLAALEMIKNGTTGFVESGGYFMEEAGEVYLESGLRGALACSCMDQGNLPESIRQTTDEVLASEEQLFERFHGKGNLKVYYSLRALMNCSEELIRQSAAEAKQKGTFLQAHMNEYAGEINYTLERYQKRPVEYLEDMGVLGEQFLAAHGIMLSAQEQRLLAQAGTQVVHCPFSNCGKGVPDTPGLLEQGVCVGLGTDGAAHGGLSLWNEMKVFRSVMNAVRGTGNADPTVMPAKTILSMTIKGGAKILGEAGRLGAVKAGYHADLISIDWMKPHLMPTANPVNTLLECVTGGDVADVMAAGKFLMRNRQVLTLDEERILWQAKKYMETKEESA